MDDKIKELELELGASKLREAHLKDAIEEKDLEIENLEAQVSKTDPSVKVSKLPQTPTKTVEVKGKHYKFIVPSFWMNSTKHLSEEAVEDAEMVAEMITEGIVGIFEEVKEESV